MPWLEHPGQLAPPAGTGIECLHGPNRLAALGQLLTAHDHCPSADGRGAEAAPGGGHGRAAAPLAAAGIEFLHRVEVPTGVATPEDKDPASDRDARQVLAGDPEAGGAPPPVAPDVVRLHGPSGAPGPCAANRIQGAADRG